MLAEIGRLGWWAAAIEVVGSAAATVGSCGSEDGAELKRWRSCVSEEVGIEALTACAGTETLTQSS